MHRFQITKRRVFFSMLGLFLLFVAYDYVTYHSRYNSAINVAHRHGARVGSLLDWPFGRECRITFEAPLDKSAMRELAILNSLAGRHWVGVALNYELDDIQLQSARDVLHDCHVFHTVDHTRQR